LRIKKLRPSGWGVITRCFLARLRSKRSVRTSVYAGFAVLLLTFASSSLVIALLAASVPCLL
ncbi:hypothetical protein, partial [Sutterella wadsworthensis]|uniref:hypothetical protein n=1 Tax=Sutterella wadsworthensis TaxID=40545 RepID=UPI003966F554